MKDLRPYNTSFIFLNLIVLIGSGYIIPHIFRYSPILAKL